jgi:two-component system response regulator RegA
MKDLLLIDDDIGYNHVLTRALSRRGYDVISALSADEALRHVKTKSFSQIILDLNLNGQSGLNLITPLLRHSPEAYILVLTGYASIPTAVEAIKLGANEYLAKPASVDTITKALAGHSLGTDNAARDHFMSVQRMEWEYIQRVLQEHDGNITATARALKMHRRTLQRKLSKRPPVV